MDGDWLDEDGHFQHDAPVDPFVDEWKEKYKDLDEIQINGAIRRQWKLGKKEIREILANCRDVLGKDNDALRREDFVLHFYGVNSPIFILFRSRLDWDHRHFLRFMSTSMRLSSNNWTVAKLYDADHPQQDLDSCMEKEEYILNPHQLIRVPRFPT